MACKFFDYLVSEDICSGIQEEMPLEYIFNGLALYVGLPKLASGTYGLLLVHSNQAGSQTT